VKQTGNNEREWELRMSRVVNLKRKKWWVKEYVSRK